MFGRSVLLIVVCAQLLFAGAASGRTWSSGLNLRMTVGSYTMPYRLYIPKNYDPEQSYPLLLFMHGAGERGTDNSSHVKPYISGMIDRTYEEYPALLVAPQVARDSSWWPDYPEDLTPEILDHVISNYSVDTNRLYVTGLSMGGFGTCDYLYYYTAVETDHFHFAAAAPLSGGFVCSEPYPELVESFKDIPQWIMHGDKDTVVTPDCSRNTYRSLVGLEAGEPIRYHRYYFGCGMTALADPIRYTEFLGYGHNIWSRVYSSDSDVLYDWMFCNTLAVCS